MGQVYILGQASCDTTAQPSGNYLYRLNTQGREELREAARKIASQLKDKRQSIAQIYAASNMAGPATGMALCRELRERRIRVQHNAIDELNPDYPLKTEKMDDLIRSSLSRPEAAIIIPSWITGASYFGALKRQVADDDNSNIPTGGLIRANEIFVVQPHYLQEMLR